MLPVCNLAMMLLADPSVGDEALVRAAACDVPLLDYARLEWLEPTRPEASAEPARISVASVSRHWVSLDGDLISTEGEPWSVELSLPAGKHLIQVGEAHDENASAAVLFEVQPGARAVWTVVPLVGGVDVIECDGDGWLQHQPTLAMADLGKAPRTWLSEHSGVACLQAYEPDFEAARIRAVAGARANWPSYGAAADGIAFEHDPARWARWQRRQLRTASVARGLEIAALIGFGFAEYAAADEDFSFIKNNTLDVWGARAATLSLLTTTALRREALVRAGEPTPKTAFILGTLIASTSLLAQHRDESEDWLVSGGARTFGATLALLQIAQNEWSQRRLRKRLRTRLRREQGASE